MLSPERLIAEHIAIAGRFTRADRQFGVQPSMNASFVGGYSELLAAAALTRRAYEPWQTTWSRAAAARTACLDGERWADVRRRATYDRRRYDEVDLWLEAGDVVAGAASSAVPLSPGLGDLLREIRPDTGARVLSVQVKARAAYRENAGYDAIPYKYFIEPGFRGSRNSLLGGAQPWKTSCVDIFVCVLWRPAPNGSARPDIRALSRRDVHNAVIASEEALHHGHLAGRSPCNCDRPLTWAARKIDFDTIFQKGLGTRLTDAVARRPRLDLS